MKEFDFEELDKAVNSLMDSVADKDEATTGTATKTVVEPTASSATTTDTTVSEQPAVPPVPAATPPAAEPTAAETPAAAPKSVFPTKRTGRFMDVVHPSSDMLQSSASSSSRPNRTGISLAPLTSKNAPPTQDSPEVNKQKELADTTAIPSDTLSDTTSNAPSPTEAYHEAEAPSSSASETDWPDPLDIAEKKTPASGQEDTSLGASDSFTAGATPTSGVNVSSETPSAELESSEEQLPADSANEKLDTLSAPEDTADTDPLVATASPFLPDAKVEKRPLGAPETSTEPESSTDSEPASSADEINNEPVEAQVTPSVNNPPELSKEVVSVESYSTEVAAEQEPASNTTQAVAPAAVSQGSASITQQYKEQPSTGDAHHEAMYDTATYGQTLAHPAKSHKSLMIILSILGLIAIGVAIGALLYLKVL